MSTLIIAYMAIFPRVNYENMLSPFPPTIDFISTTIRRLPCWRLADIVKVLEADLPLLSLPLTCVIVMSWQVTLLTVTVPVLILSTPQLVAMTLY